jgi:hypothetical protein
MGGYVMDGAIVEESSTTMMGDDGAGMGGGDSLGAESAGKGWSGRDEIGLVATGESVILSGGNGNTLTFWVNGDSGGVELQSGSNSMKGASSEEYCPAGGKSGIGCTVFMVLRISDRDATTRGMSSPGSRRRHERGDVAKERLEGRLTEPKGALAYGFKEFDFDRDGG